MSIPFVLGSQWPRILTNYSYSAELDMTVNMLIQVDKLVQLIESPVFTCAFDPRVFSMARANVMSS